MGRGSLPEPARAAAAGPAGLTRTVKKPGRISRSRSRSDEFAYFNLPLLVISAVAYKCLFSVGEDDFDADPNVCARSGGIDDCSDFLAGFEGVPVISGGS